MEKSEKIKHFEALAAEIRDNIASRKRALIVEFAGMPKAGKTTVVNSLSLFLRRNGIKTVVVTERAAVSPIKNKHHPDFNIWTGCTSLARMLEFRRSSEFMVIILDRGVFDSLIWLNSLHRREKISSKELEKLEGFFLLERFVKDVDLVICLKTSIQSALDREYKDVLTDKPGSIMNHDFLKEYIKALDNTVEKHRDKVTELVEIDTTETETIEGVELSLTRVIESLRDLSDETLAVIDRAQFDERLSINGFSSDKNEFRVLARLLTNNKTVMKRRRAEDATDMLQIVACAIIKYENQIAVFQKLERSQQNRLHEKRMIWVGGHLQAADFNERDGHTPLEAMKSCLKRELEEELEQTIERPMPLRGLVYDRTNPRSLQHLGVVFEIELNNEYTKKALDGRIIRELSGQGVEIKFVVLDERVLNDYEHLEPWTVEILRSLYSLKIERSSADYQMVIF